MAWALTQSGFSADLAELMGSLPGGAFTFFCVSILTFIVLGSVLEGIPAIVLLGPLLFPIAEELGINDVHRSEEHTSELQSLMRISYAVFCLKKKNQQTADAKQTL